MLLITKSLYYLSDVLTVFFLVITFMLLYLIILCIRLFIIFEGFCFLTQVYMVGFYNIFINFYFCQ